jgi:hypothetical protein
MFEFMPAVVASENSIRRRNGGNESEHDCDVAWASKFYEETLCQWQH